MPYFQNPGFWLGFEAQHLSLCLGLGLVLESSVPSLSLENVSYRRSGL